MRNIARQLDALGVPFANVPNTARYFPSCSIEDARQRLCDCIERDLGPALLVGPPGTGKSLLLDVLEQEFRERFRVVSLKGTRLCTRRAFLQWLLSECGLPYEAFAEGELRLALHRYLKSKEHCGSGLVLLVDEAHILPVRILEEMRILLNLAQSGVSRVRIVLAGAHSLEEVFAHPALESFAQRLTARCYLASFGRDEVQRYVRAQLAVHEEQAPLIFDDEALVALYNATDGVPRLVNQLCAHVTARHCHEEGHVGAADVQAAWADLQRLPAPWPEESKGDDSSSNIVEFGSLDDDVDEASAGGIAEGAFDMSPADSLADGEQPLADSAEVEEEPARQILPLFHAAEPAPVDGPTPVTPPRATSDDETVAELKSCNWDAFADAKTVFSASTDLPIAESSGQIAVPEFGERDLGPAAEHNNPFAEEFQQEEIVIDEFVYLEDNLRTNRLRVTNHIDGRLATEIEGLLLPRPVPHTAVHDAADVDDEPEIYAIPYIAHPPDLAAMHDPVTPDPPQENDVSPPEPVPPVDARSPSKTVRPLHRRYGTLFASLRRG